MHCGCVEVYYVCMYVWMDGWMCYVCSLSLHHRFQVQQSRGSIAAVAVGAQRVLQVQARVMHTGAQALHCLALGLTSQANGGAITSRHGKTSKKVND